MKQGRLFFYLWRTGSLRHVRRYSGTPWRKVPDHPQTAIGITSSGVESKRLASLESISRAALAYT